MTASLVYQISGFETLKIGRIHTHTHTHDTSGRQLKITFLDVLDYSECSDTNISKKNFITKTASSVKKQKVQKEVLKLKKIHLSYPIYFFPQKHKQTQTKLKIKQIAIYHHVNIRRHLR